MPDCQHIGGSPDRLSRVETQPARRPSSLQGMFVDFLGTPRIKPAIQAKLSLSQKLILFCLLLVTGTGWLVARLCSAETSRELRAIALEDCTRRATQIVDILGPALFRDPAPAPSGALQRVLRNDPASLGIYSVVNQDGRAVIAQEARRDGKPRPYGTPLALTHAGHRANRTGEVESLVVHLEDDDKDARIIRTFAPVLDKDRSVIGLLVVETDFVAATRAATVPWSAILIPLLAALIAIGLLVHSLSRPLECLQEQLVTKENLPPRRVHTPSDLLREVTRIVDTAQTDHTCYELRERQREQEQENANRLKDAIIANTVHELRTPLTSIIASLELVLHHKDMMSSDEQLEFLEQAVSAGRHMMFVVNDMLDSAAIEEGKFTMEIEPCNLAKTFTDAKRSMDMVAASRGTELVVPEIDSNVHVMADNSRVLQVIFNLISNSVKYSPRTIRSSAWHCHLLGLQRVRWTGCSNDPPRESASRSRGGG